MPQALAIPADVVCLCCGYSLKGLSPDGSCPECNTTVQRSLRGGGLMAASPDYVARLRLGAGITMMSVLADVAWMMVIPLALGVGVHVLQLTLKAALLIILLADCAAAITGLAGSWLLSSPDPARGSLNDRVSRRVLRTLLLTGAAGTLAQVLTHLIPMLAQSPWSALSGSITITKNTQWTAALIAALSLRSFLMLAKLAKFFAGLVYLRGLAASIPSPDLRRRCGTQLWYIPLMGTVGIAIIVGPLLAVYSYLRTLHLFRKRLGQVLTSQRESTPRPRP